MLDSDKDQVEEQLEAGGSTLRSLAIDFAVVDPLPDKWSLEEVRELDGDMGSHFSLLGVGRCGRQ